MRTPEITELKRQIQQAFLNSRVPHVMENNHVGCDECADISEGFSNLSWDTAPIKIIDHNFSGLPLFSAQGFHDFLPAYLLRSLDAFSQKLDSLGEFDLHNPINDVCQYTIYALAPELEDRPGNPLKFIKERFALFNKEQRTVIRNFLELVLATPSFRTFHEEAKRGIDVWWEDVNEK